VEASSVPGPAANEDSIDRLMRTALAILSVHCCGTFEVTETLLPPTRKMRDFASNTQSTNSEHLGGRRTENLIAPHFSAIMTSFVELAALTATVDFD